MNSPLDGWASGSTCRQLLSDAGYNPDLSPRGVAGPPGEFDGWHFPPGGPVNGTRCKLRNWVCALGGYLIDGHSDPDNTGLCIHCGKEWW